MQSTVQSRNSSRMVDCAKKQRTGGGGGGVGVAKGKGGARAIVCSGQCMHARVADYIWRRINYNGCTERSDMTRFHTGQGRQTLHNG